jgi:hypothetical protein
MKDGLLGPKLLQGHGAPMSERGIAAGGLTSPFMPHSAPSFTREGSVPFGAEACLLRIPVREMFE